MGVDPKSRSAPVCAGIRGEVMIERMPSSVEMLTATLFALSTYTLKAMSSAAMTQPPVTVMSGARLYT